MLTTAHGHLAWVLFGGALMGAAFGFSWSFMGRRVLGALTDEDRAIGSSAIMAVRQTGAAAGAAISGAAANRSMKSLPGTNRYMPHLSDTGDDLGASKLSSWPATQAR